MKTLWQSRQTYRGLRSSKGLALQRDLWKFAVWVGARLGQQIQVDGVERAHENHFDDDLNANATNSRFSFGQERYRFRRSGGLASVEDARRFMLWLKQQLTRVMRSNDAGVRLLPGKDDQVLIPRGRGILLRKDLLALIRSVADRLGFGVACDDSTGMSEGFESFRVRREPGIAKLQTTVTRLRGHSSPCVLGESTEDPSNYVVETVETQTYENGTIHITNTAAGDVKTWFEGGAPDACAEVEVTNDADPELDYGNFISTSTAESVTLSKESVAAAAVAKAAGDPAPDTAVEEYSWYSASWQLVSEGSWGVDLAVHQVVEDADVYHATLLDSAVLKNTGNARLKIGYAWSGGGGSGTITLNPGASHTFTPGFTPTLADSRVLSLTSIKIGPYI